MVALSGGMQAPCSNGSQWRFVEEVQVKPQQGYEPVAKLLGSGQLLGGTAASGSDWTAVQHTGGNLLLLGYSG